MVAGTMRSTIVLGKATFSCSQRSKFGSTRLAYSSTSPASRRPLAGRLSQESTVNRPAAREAADPEPGDEEADRGLRAGRIGVGRGRVRVGGGELPRRRVVAVALLGHGEADDLRARVRERAHDVAEVFAEEERAPDRADDGDARPGDVPLEHAVQPALRLQPVARQSGDCSETPTMPQCGCPGERRVGVHGLVGAMERAGPR